MYTECNHFLFNECMGLLGVCGLGVRLQGMESDNLRKFYRMAELDTGVLVAQVFPLAPAKNILQRGDVILSMDGIRVSPLLPIS